MSRRKPNFFAHENAETRRQPIAQQPEVVLTLLTGIKENPGYDMEDYMSRKRTPDQKSTETNTPVITPQETSTAVAEPPAAEAKADAPGFAERVGQRSRVTAPDPFGIAHDNLAGVRLFESRQDRQMAIKFEEKPSRAVLDRLRDAGWVWRQADRIWAHALRPESAMSTRIEAERLYQELCKMIRHEKGAGQEVPF